MIVPVTDRLTQIAQMCDAPSDAYSAGEWCHAANDLLAVVAQLQDALRGMLELDSYRPRDGSVNEDWERKILASAFVVMGVRPFHATMLHNRLRDPAFREAYEAARAELDGKPLTHGPADYDYMGPT